MSKSRAAPAANATHVIHEQHHVALCFRLAHGLVRCAWAACGPVQRCSVSSCALSLPMYAIFSVAPCLPRTIRALPHAKQPFEPQTWPSPIPSKAKVSVTDSRDLFFKKWNSPRKRTDQIGRECESGGRKCESGGRKRRDNGAKVSVTDSRELFLKCGNPHENGTKVSVESAKVAVENAKVAVKSAAKTGRQCRSPIRGNYF